MKTALQILKEARELISVPERWTQETYARSADGEPAPLESDAASCWCIAGAMRRCAGLTDDGFTVSYDRAYAAFREAIGNRGVPMFNDSSTHADALAAFDRAIARLEAQS